MKIRIKIGAEITEIDGLLSSGLFDKNGMEIFESDNVKIYYKGQFVVCKIIFKDGLFCLKWPDGYINNYQLNSSQLEVYDIH